MKIALVVLLALAAVVAAVPTISVENAGGKFHWKLSDGDTLLLKSDSFDDKGSCVRSAAAVLANAGHKDRCSSTLGVLNANNQLIGKTKAVNKEQQQQHAEEHADIQEQRALLHIAPGTPVKCDAIHKAVHQLVSEFVEAQTKTENQQVGQTKIIMEIKQNEKKEYYFHIQAGNGEILMTSETYHDHHGAVNGLKSVLLNGGVKGGYTIKKSSNDKHYFTLKAVNHEKVAVSQMYASRSNAKRGRNDLVDTIRKILQVIVDKDTTDDVQAEQKKKEQGKEQSPKPEQVNKKAEQQAKKQQQAQPQQAAVDAQAVGQAQGQRPMGVGGQQAAQSPAQMQPQGPTPQGDAQRAQQQAQKDDNDVDDDDSDVEDDSDDSDDDDADM